MTQSIPTFWVRYRGVVDPQRQFGINYRYVADLFYSTDLTFTNPVTITFNVLGPPQLNKRDYMELNWTIPPGIIRISISKQQPTYASPFYQTNAAEQGTRDEGQYNVINGGVQNI